LYSDKLQRDYTKALGNGEKGLIKYYVRRGDHSKKRTCI